MTPKMPAILETRATRLLLKDAVSLRRTSPVGRSITSAGALGEEGEVKVYESVATWTLMSLYGSVMMGQ